MPSEFRCPGFTRREKFWLAFESPVLPFFDKAELVEIREIDPPLSPSGAQWAAPESVIATALLVSNRRR